MYLIFLHPKGSKVLLQPIGYLPRANRLLAQKSPVRPAVRLQLPDGQVGEEWQDATHKMKFYRKRDSESSKPQTCLTKPAGIRFQPEGQI